MSEDDLSFKPDELPEDRSLVLVDDDRAFLLRLARAMELRGFEVRTRPFGGRGAGPDPPEGAGLRRRRHAAGGRQRPRRHRRAAKLRPQARTIVLTGYGNIATAVSAVKLGAVDYLAKPADADDVTDALLAPHDEKAPPPENPMSADRVRWEHIQRVYELCNRNVSETARRLNMHRRTLQRILAKRAPK